MKNCLIDAPKMFRKMQNLTLRDLKLENALETLWDCSNIIIDNTSIKNGDYLAMKKQKTSPFLI